MRTRLYGFSRLRRSNRENDVFKLSEAATRGDRDSQYQVGIRLLERIRLPSSVTEARYWLEKAASQGHVEAQYRLHLLLRDGRAIDPAVEKRPYTLLREGSIPAELARNVFYPLGFEVRPDDEMSFEWGMRAAWAGHAAAQVSIGRLFMDSSHERFDPGSAMKWLLKAAALSNGDACYYIGILHANGLGVIKDVKKSQFWYERAIQFGSAHAGLALGFILRDGVDCEADPSKAAKLFELAAVAGVARAKHNLAVLYMNGTGVERDPKKAFHFFVEAATSGYVPSMMHLGRDARRKQQFQDAIYWLSKAENAGESEAAAELITVKNERKNNEEKALGYSRTGANDRAPELVLRRRAEANDIDASLRLAHLLMRPGRSSADRDEAIVLFSKCAEAGNAAAQFVLGWFHLEGKGVVKSDEIAVSLFAKAAASGHPRAQFQLGTMLQTGRGVAKDDEKAARWHLAAAEQGDLQAKFNYAMLKLNEATSEALQVAIQCLTSAAEGGLSEAFLKLGDIYSSKNNFANERSALECYRKAQELGNLEASVRMKNLVLTSKN